MNRTLEHSPADTQHEVAETEMIEKIEELCEAMQQAARAVQQDPNQAEGLGNLKKHCVETARLLLSSPEIAPTVITPLGEAAETLYRADNVGPKTDRRVTETLGEIAASIPMSVTERTVFIKIAMVKATEFFRQHHASDSEVGKDLDERLITAFKNAIHMANANLPFQTAFEQEFYRAIQEVEAKYVDQSDVAEYHRDRLLQKTDRLANYAEKGRDVTTESTGVVIPPDVTGPISVIESSRMPSYADGKEFEAWKKSLQKRVPVSIARTAMLDDQFERIATPDDMDSIRAELDDLNLTDELEQLSA